MVFYKGEERELVCVVEILTGDEKLNRVQEVDEMASCRRQASSLLPMTTNLTSQSLSI